MTKQTKSSIAKELASEQRDALLETLKVRFEAHMHRHEGLEWSNINARLKAHTEKRWSLHEME